MLFRLDLAVVPEIKQTDDSGLAFVSSSKGLAGGPTCGPTLTVWRRARRSETPLDDCDAARTPSTVVLITSEGFQARAIAHRSWGDQYDGAKTP
jgi:hypothetical protein